MNPIETSIELTPVMPASAVPDVRFVGDRRAYWRLLIRGAALLAVTLGIYRFWFATDVRRYLWSHTEVAGDTMEYNGTAYELLIGFLIAIALLVPLNLGLFVVALNLGEIGALSGFLAFPLLAFLGQFAVYRARRYRLTRTIYRGIRCHQGGSAWNYATRAILWWTLIAITLGLAYPFAQASLERFKMRHTYYGNLGGRFEGSGLRLLMRGLPMWFLAIGLPVLALAYAAATADWGQAGVAAAVSKSANHFNSVIAITAATIGVMMAVLLFPVFQAMTMRWWLSGLRFGALTLDSHLRTRQIYGAYLRFLWYSLLFSMAISVVGGIVYVALKWGLSSIGRSELTEIVNAFAGVGLYVTAMLGYSTIYQGTVKLSLWRCGVESIDLAGISALDQVTADGAPSSAVGEGLADALDVGGL